MLLYIAGVMTTIMIFSLLLVLLYYLTVLLNFNMDDKEWAGLGWPIFYFIGNKLPIGTLIFFYRTITRNIFSL